MGKKKKEIGNGFVFRLIQAIIYLLTALGFLAGCLITNSYTNQSLVGYYEENYSYEKSFSVYMNGSSQYVYDYGSIVFIEKGVDPYLIVAKYNQYENEAIRFDFESESAKERKITFKNRETNEIIIIDYDDIESSFSYDYEAFAVMTLAFAIVCGIMALFTVFQFLVTFFGKKSIRANNLCIVLNFLFGLGSYGLLGLVGGIKGRMYLQFTLLGYGYQNKTDESAVEPSVRNERVNVASAQPNTEESDAESNDADGQSCETPALEYIQPKISKNGKKAVMIVLLVSYVLLLVFGILLAAVPALASMISGMGICEEISAQAYAITIGTMFAALVPSVGYYFATISPYEISKRNRIIIAAVTTILIVVMNVVFFLVINFATVEGIPVKEFYETSDSWFVPLSMVFASVGLMICYALTLFRMNPAAIKDLKAQKTGDGIFHMIKYLFFALLCGILKLVKMILKFKEKQVDVFVLIASVLLTWLAFFAAFIFAIICIAIFVGVIIMYFVGVISTCYSYGSSESNGKQVQILDGGVYKTLTYNPYFVEERGEQVFEDAAGNRWYSTNGGKTVYQK